MTTTVPDSTDRSGNPAPRRVAVAAREVRTDTLDCSDDAVSATINREIDELPFLGALYCDTAEVVAGSVCEIVLDYVVGASGIADSGWLKLCFKYYSDWDLQTDDPQGRDYVTAEITHRSTLGVGGPADAGTARELKVRYDVKGGERPYQKAVVIHVVDGYLRPGDVITIRFGDRRAGGPGTRVQTFVEHGFPLLLHVDTLGTSRMAQACEHRLDVVAGPPDRLVVTSPRLVREGSVVPVRAHLQDAWGNACTPLEVQMVADSDVLEGTTVLEPVGNRWAAGLARCTARQTGTGDIVVTATAPDGTLWSASTMLDVVGVDELPALPGSRAVFADLHVHSDDTVGTQDTPWNLAYGREVGSLDILGYTANDFQVTDEAWDETVRQCDAAGDTEFVCYPGVEWCGNAGVGGDHNVVYVGSDATLARSLEWRIGMNASVPVPEHWPITRLYDAYAAHPEDYLMIPHVGGRRGMLHWHHPHLERLIEVHSAWGTSPFFYEEALRRGLRLGVSAASDEHRGRPGSGAPGANIFGGRGGLTGVLTPQLAPRAVADTLRDRRTWATTGARAVGLLSTNDAVMGDDVTLTDDRDRIDVDLALFADGTWDEVTLRDADGVLALIDLHAEAGYSPDLVRVRWGGARHRDRYRWATWRGAIEVGGTSVASHAPWARLDPESRIDHHDACTTVWSRTYGNTTGMVLSLDDLASATISVELEIAEEGRGASFTVDGAALLSDSRTRTDLGGADLHVVVERVADPAHLPRTVRRSFDVITPLGQSLVYARARQWDGQELWTSPLFLQR
ncbi:DUF3604 domain-containing protein [Nocardioides endophyticus]|uniref:DUF3604 domain-containing protein n=1 Tax=Nocardioides endophyticus TaxID=1353775 RepID=A0ABP8YJU2_9ACTN